VEGVKIGFAFQKSSKSGQKLAFLLLGNPGSKMLLCLTGSEFNEN
jgi:hypothetical protein